MNGGDGERGCTAAISQQDDFIFVIYLRACFTSIKDMDLEPQDPYLKPTIMDLLGGTEIILDLDGFIT